MLSSVFTKAIPPDLAAFAEKEVLALIHQVAPQDVANLVKRTPARVGDPADQERRRGDRRRPADVRGAFRDAEGGGHGVMNPPPRLFPDGPHRMSRRSFDRFAAKRLASARRDRAALRAALAGADDAEAARLRRQLAVDPRAAAVAVAAVRARETVAAASCVRAVAPGPPVPPWLIRARDAVRAASQSPV